MKRTRLRSAVGIKQLDPDGYRRKMERQREKLYGLTPQQYQLLLQSQNERCAICLRHKDEVVRGLAIDHDHVTKRVRGLLCLSCNTILGLSKESVEVLEATVAYLAKHKASP